ncbi:MAG: hypothetical protein JWQ23_3071, partial [Herminiimonas sp.]|nr:hypothetical protein [Herminiimonas sp.]
KIGTVSNLFPEQSGHAQPIPTGIHKHPVSSPVMIRQIGIAGDEQADARLHGGLDKAVYAYPLEHYSFWTAHRLKTLRRHDPLPPGSMGENLTLTGLLEKDIWVGDRLLIGDTVLEVTEPRTPCFKFGVKMGFAHAVKLMAQSGATGFYMRVLQPGSMIRGDAVTVLPGARQMSIDAINLRRRSGPQHELF